MRVLLVYNAKAGEDNRGREMLRLLQAEGHEVLARDKESDLAKVLREPADLVVVAGGDGTVAKVAQHLIGSSTPLTILPIGTANNLATTLGLTAQPEELVAGWGDADLRPLDAAQATLPKGRFTCFESVGFGLFTEAMCQAMSREDSEAKLTAEERFERDFRFLHRLAADFPGQPCTVKIDGETLETDALLCVIMNSRQIGSRLVLAPGADPGDGLLDLILVSERDRPLLRDFFRREPSDDHLPHLPARRAHRIRVRGRAARIHLDDEIETLPPSSRPWTLEVTVEPGAVQILVPRA